MFCVLVAHTCPPWRACPPQAGAVPMLFVRTDVRLPLISFRAASSARTASAADSVFDAVRPHRPLASKTYRLTLIV